MKREELQQMLVEDIPDIEGKELWIWGTGGTAGLYQEGLDRIELGSKIIGYCDNNKEKWGKEFCGKPVISPEALKARDNVCALVCSLQPGVSAEIVEGLHQLGIIGYLIDEVIFKSYSEEVLKCYDLLEDDASREIYAELVVSRMKGKRPEARFYSDNSYFIHQRIAARDIGKTFVDCGAYVGDTIERYIWQTDGVVDRIIGIEPDLENYKALLQRKSRLCAEWNIAEQKLKMVCAGVGDKTETRMLMSINDGLGSQFADGNEAGIEQKMIALDDLLTEPYSFLKADIESFEYKMLLGAKNGIVKWKPDIAVCIYHNAVDFFSIACLIHRMIPEYKFAVRHHSHGLLETVLYAWAT